MSKIKIDIYSDIACPWCYVAEKSFSLSMESFKELNPSAVIELNWHAYMIDPQTETLGEEYMAYNIRRWGGDGWTSSLRKAGKKVGCNFKDWK